MRVTMLPLAPEPLATTPARDAASLLEELATLRLENATLRGGMVALQVRVRDLEARLGQNWSNLSRPPSSDPPQAPARPKAPPSGRKRGGQPGHRGTYRALLPVAQVDEVVAVQRSAAGIVNSRFLNPLTALVAGSGAIRWWSYCRWRCG
jgi:hypothetical protein